MSMKLRGLLADKYSSRVENAYLETADVMVLDDVPCEMEFKTEQAFMEHENEQHNYLPVFHLMGHVKSISGKFPFDVTTLVFSEEDQQSLVQDCIYYMKPEEIAYMITTGKFYSKRFQIPEVLSNNTYKFPAHVKLTIVPPPNQAAFEASRYGQTDGVNVDKDNLPIFYVGILGTGITRKNDPLLDYYGITMDDTFASFALTAESSGYTTPPLMMYMPEPEVEEEMTPEERAEYYVTEEEEADMIHALDEQKAEKEHADAQMDVQSDYQMPDMESAIVEKANRNIERRLAQRQQAKQLVVSEMESVKETDLSFVSEKESEKDIEIAKEDIVEKVVVPEMTPKEVAQEKVIMEKAAEKDDVEHFVPEEEQSDELDLQVDESESDLEMDDISLRDDGSEQASVDEDVLTESDEDYYFDEEDDFVETEEVPEDVLESEFLEDEDSVEVVDVPEEVLSDEVMDDKLTEPDVPQQYRESQMDLNPEENTYVEAERKENMDVVSNVMSDEDALQDMNGADVSDVKLQTKVDEAHAKEQTKNTAVEIQERVSESKEGMNGDVHREAPANMQEIAERYANGVDEMMGISF